MSMTERRDQLVAKLAREYINYCAVVSRTARFSIDRYVRWFWPSLPTKPRDDFEGVRDLQQAVRKRVAELRAEK